MSHANIPRSRRFSLDTTVSSIREFGFGANFDPLTLFKDGKQGAWYDPSDKSTLFQDVEGTVPVTKDGDPVALIRDKSGNSNHATQPVSTARPVYKTDGVLHWLFFDGVDDKLIVPASLADRTFTFGFGYLKPLQSESIILIDSLQNNPWGLSGIKGSTLVLISNTNGKILSMKGNGASSSPKTRGAVYTLFEDNNVITFAASFPSTEERPWGASFGYGAYTGGGFNAFSKLTGLVLIEGQQTDIQLDTYLASRSGVTL